MKKTNFAPVKKLSLNKRTIMKLNDAMMLNLLGGSEVCTSIADCRSNVPRQECITIPTRKLDENTNCVNGTTGNTGTTS